VSERRRLPLTARLGVVALLLLVLAGVRHFYGAEERELLVRLPPGSENVASVELRIVREGGTQLFRTLQPKNTGGRTVVLHAKLPRGDLRLEAWPAGSPPCEGRVTLAGEASAEVDLMPRR
jgi:hypothetical protein